MRVAIVSSRLLSLADRWDAGYWMRIDEELRRRGLSAATATDEQFHEALEAYVSGYEEKMATIRELRARANELMVEARKIESADTMRSPPRRLRR